MPTTPPTFAAGDILEADQLNQLSDGIVELQAASEGTTFSGCQLRRTGTQSISTATWTTVTWQTESGGFDIGGWWTSGTDIVVPAGAIPSGVTQIAVDVTARTQFSANTTNSRYIRILLNGSETERGSKNADGSGDTTEVWCQDAIVVASGDIITVQVYQTSGSTLTIAGSNTKVTLERRGTVA